MPTQTVEQFDHALRTGTLGSVYLFDGPENWLKERHIEALIKKLVPKEARDFNFEKFDANAVTAGQVVGSAQSLPFLSERRLLVVQSIDEFSTADAEILADALPHLPTSTCLILLQSSKANLRNILPAAVNSHGVIVTFWTPFSNQLPAWVDRECKRRGKDIEMDAARALAESCGDLQELSNEIDKLILFVGKKPIISWVDLVAHGLPDLSGDQRDFEEGLYLRDLKTALTYSRVMGDLGTRPEALIATIERVFRNLVLAFFYREEKGWSQEDIEQALRIRGMTQKNLFRQAMRVYQRTEVEGVFEKIIEADYQMKSGTLPGEIAVTLLLLALLRKGDVVRR